jgi:hypothetical protein
MIALGARRLICQAATSCKIIIVFIVAKFALSLPLSRAILVKNFIINYRGDQSLSTSSGPNPILEEAREKAPASHRSRKPEAAQAATPFAAVELPHHGRGR